MCSCRLCLVWTFDGWWFGISVTRGWISFNMKAFFFCSLQPYWGEWWWKEQSQEKKLRGPERKRGGERMKRRKHVCLRGEASEERRVSLVLFEPAHVHGRSCKVPLRDALNYGKNKSRRGEKARWDCDKSFVEILIWVEEGGPRPWQIQGTVCHCMFGSVCTFPFICPVK